jgi:kynurenine 3-monooxygenase
VDPLEITFRTVMPGPDRPQFVLVGSGLAGALLATYLGKAGYDVDLYERRPDPAESGDSGGRSINLALSTRGIAALQEVGLADAALHAAIPMRGRMIHELDGRLHYQPYDKDPSRYINSIGRSALNNLTIEAARALPNVRIYFDHKCTDVDLDAPAATILNGRTGESIQAAGDILIGVDGAYSAVRRGMQRLDRFDYSQDYLAHGYKELTIPPAAGGAFQMEKNALHIWPRHRFMMIALPNCDGSFTCTLFWPFEGPSSFASITSDDDLRRFFRANFPDAMALMPTLADDYDANPTGSLMTVRCAPWHYRGKLALLGDACHAVVPFYGQGMNAAFEDCSELAACIHRFAPDWGRVLSEYESRRRVHTDALADLAIDNFVEMRDRTASPLFRGRKMFERTLHTLLPRWYVPLYSMVSFSRIPYAQARTRARRRDRIVFGVAAALALLVVAMMLWVAL